MNYRYLSIAETVQALITAVVSVGCALAGFAYWSLIAGNLAGRAGNIALAIYWRPVPFAVPRREQVMAPLRFGMHIAAQRIVGTLGTMSDSMVIGRILGQSPLGAYRQASNLATAPADKIGALIMRVTGPLFARVQNDVHLMRRYFLIFSETLAIAIFPLVFGLAVVAPEAVDLLLGDKWASAALPLRWLTLYMAIRTMGYPIGQLLTTLRFNRFGTWMAFLNFTLMTVAFVVASLHWGLQGVALAWLLMSPITFVPVAVKVLRAIGCGFRQYLHCLTPALAGSSAMLVVLVSMRPWLTASHWPGYARLAAEVAAGAIAYCAVVLGLYRGRVMPYFRFFLKLRKKNDGDSGAEIIVESI
jgi:O-antigen/teichoic acid export membrane protein